MNKFVNLGITVLVVIGLAGCAPLAEQPVTEAGENVGMAEITSSETISPEINDADEVESNTDNEADSPVGVSSDAGAGQLSAESETVELLTYLIEEEKLAHDVYTVLYDMYGSKVFGNILESESKHQDQVMDLLDAYGVADPRSSEHGVFNDKDLQSLYDELIAMGSKSAADAYQVGVLIEEKDIADITAQLATTPDQAVVDVLEKLRSASENHLRAFNRQL